MRPPPALEGEARAEDLAVVVGHLAVGLVTPPGEHVGVLEAGSTEAVFGLLEGGGRDRYAGIGGKRVGDGAVHNPSGRRI